MSVDLNLTNFDNQKFRLMNTVNRYLEEKNIDVDNRLFNFEKSIKNLASINNKIIQTQKVVCILNKIRNSIFDFYTHWQTFCKLTKKFQPQRLDKVLSKYQKHSISVREIEDIIMNQ